MKHECTKAERELLDAVLRGTDEVTVENLRVRIRTEALDPERVAAAKESFLASRRADRACGIALAEAGLGGEDNEYLRRQLIVRWNTEWREGEGAK